MAVRKHPQFKVELDEELLKVLRLFGILGAIIVALFIIVPHI